MPIYQKYGISFKFGGQQRRLKVSVQNKAK